MLKATFSLSLLAVSCLASSASFASAVLPSTSAVIINEGDKEGTIGIKNTQDKPVVLYSKIRRLEDEDMDGVLIPVPAAVTVQPGETQIVRVLFRSNKPLDKEHLARIVFTGIPPEDGAGGARVGFILGQDLPVVIRPKNHPLLEDKWKQLKWTVEQQKLCVGNDTKSVIRYNSLVSVLPAKIGVTMPRTYSLPGTKHCADLPADYRPAAGAEVEFSAMTDFNYLRNEIKLPLTIVAGK